MVSCYLGIDVGTQGLTALLVESQSPSPSPSSSSSASSSASVSLNVIAKGEGSYDFVPNLDDGCYEQEPNDWDNALIKALKKIQNDVNVAGTKINIKSICVTGQMHGCVLMDKNGSSIGTARLWCDSRNQEEADELTELFGERMPKRLTAARYLWSLKHEPEKASKCVAITTPAGYITHRLTTPILVQVQASSSSSSITNSNNWNQPLLLGGRSLILGVGEASGMFPIDDDNSTTGGCCEYKSDWTEIFDQYVRTKFSSSSLSSFPPSLKDLLPRIRTAGDIRNNNPVLIDKSIFMKQTNGLLMDLYGLFLNNNENGGEINTNNNILVAPAEGDQPTALAASLIGEPGMISCSFGTSVVANMVGGRKSKNSKGNSHSPKKKPRTTSSSSSSSSGMTASSVDKFNAVNGLPISMVWLRNGTTYLNRMVDSYGGDFDTLLKQAIEAPTDCGGLLALPFLDDEPGLDVKRGGTALIVGFNSSNNNNGNVIKATLISVMFNLLLGTKQVEEANEKDEDDKEEEVETTKKEIILTGGLTKTPQTGQILADIFDRPVRLLEAADEGGAWGAALLAKYYHECSSSATSSSSSSSSSSPDPNDWLSFLRTIKAKEEQVFLPHLERVQIYRKMLTKYKKLLKLQPQLDEVMNGPP